MIYAIYDYSDDSNAFIESLYVFNIKNYMASKYNAELCLEQRNEQLYESEDDIYFVVRFEPGEYVITNHGRTVRIMYCIDIQRFMHDEFGAIYYGNFKNGWMFKSGWIEYEVRKENKNETL